MKKKLIIFSFFFLIFNFNLSKLSSQINNKIIATVGNSLLTSVDIKNEISTRLLINKKKFNQENINNAKTYAVKTLINTLIKKNEINKFGVKRYNKADLIKYTDEVSKSLNTDIEGLKNIFKVNGLNYEVFVENYKIELIWNSLIYDLYKNQININIIEVKNEIDKTINNENLEYNLSEIQILNSQNSQTKISEVLEVIKKEGFEIAAKKFSVSKTAANNGLIGWVEKNSLSQKYLEEVAKISIKEISKPILIENFFLILRINNIKKKNDNIKLSSLKDKIMRKKKEDKLNLFSRSHFSNLESSTSISFK